MDIIDLRSDTVTKPTEAMMEAIMKAELGDDGRSREDPTVNMLEALAAEMTGKEAAMLVPSGTMGNTIAVLASTQRGDRVIVERTAHLYTTEFGSWMVLGNLFPITLTGEIGIISPEQLEDEILSSMSTDPNNPKGPTLVCVENTHNRASGAVMSVEAMKGIYQVAKKYGLKVHCDGARIFNASVKLGIDVKELTQYTDSLMFCISKGLSAPIGSLICGSEEFIEESRYYRKIMGGMMRQAGIIAAPGVVALNEMVDRLAEDHETAAIISEGVEEIDGLKLLFPTETNIVYVDLSDLGITGGEFKKLMGEEGIRTGGGKAKRARMVTHRHISKADAEYAVEALKKLVQKVRA